MHGYIVLLVGLSLSSLTVAACSQAEVARGVDGGVAESVASIPIVSGEPMSPAAADAIKREVSKTTEQWKAELPAETFHVMFEKGTERPFCGGGSWDEHRKGVYHCAACDALLFNSDAKFDSGTGWPSFKGVAIAGAADVVRDESHGMVRDEVVCHRCGGHLGHVFSDGPPPTGQRYCMNGVAMKFVPDAVQPTH